MFFALRAYELFILTIILFCVTYLNKFSMVILPISLIFLYFLNPSKHVNRIIYSLLSLVFIGFLIGLVNDKGFLILNGAISLIFILAFFTMFHLRFPSDSNVELFVKFFIVLMLANGLVGFFQFAIYRYDDAFIGIYGRSGLETHALSFIYSILSAFLYYDQRLFSRKRSLQFSFFFFLCSVMCFYGTGLVIFFASLAFVVLFNIGFFRFFFLGFVCLLGYFLIDFFNPGVLDYYLNNIFLFYEGVISYYDGYFDPQMPRRVIFVVDFFNAFLQDLLWLFFGIGGGSFNSRISFLLNGDYSSFSFLPVSRHYLADELVFSHWNSELLSSSFSDGSRNQPFSSYISVLAEYGLFFFVILYTSIIYTVYKIFKKINPSLGMFLSCFLFMILAVENLADYHDVLFVVSLLMAYIRLRF